MVGLAENGWIAAAAYFCAFMPWGIIYAFDFIGDRWKTIKETFKEGILHIFFTLLPLSYVMIYAYLQFKAENFQEMAAALTASALSILHVFRTTWGLIQLSVFEDWAIRALQCLSNMGYTIKMHRGIDDDDGVRDAGDAPDDDFLEDDVPKTKRRFCSGKAIRRTVRNCMIVNNTLIDNAFHGGELPVRFWRPSTPGTLAESWKDWCFRFLKCTKPEECAIRWSVAFLSRFGASWLEDCGAERMNPRVDQDPLGATGSEPQETPCIQSAKTQTIILRNLAVLAFQHVTKRGFLSPNDDEKQMRSLIDPPIDIRDWTELCSTLCPQHVSNFCFPYRSAPLGKFVLSRFKHTISDAKSSWQTLALNALSDDEHFVVSGISETQIAWFLYIFSKDPTMTHNFLHSEDGNSTSPSSWAHESFLEQISLKNRISFSALMKAAPIPNDFIDIPLWPESALNGNYLLLQASAHIDNWVALDTGEKIKEMDDPVVLRKMQTVDHDLVFQIQKRFEMDRRARSGKYADGPVVDTVQFYGCIVESVRSIIAACIYAKGKHEDWNLVLARPSIFSISPQLEQSLQRNNNPNRSTCMRLLWEAQSGMEAALSKNTFTPPHTMEEAALLCILGFPSLIIERASPSSYMIRPIGAPEDIRLSLTIAPDGTGSGKKNMWMRATDGRGSSGLVAFHWVRWRDAFFGRLYAHSLWRNRNEMGKVHRGLLTASMMSLCEETKVVKVHRTDQSEKTLTWEVPLWDGWRPHNPQITCFEVFQVFSSKASTRKDKDSLTDAITAVENAISGNLQIPQSDHSWIEDCSSVAEMHRKAVKEMDKNNTGKALQGLSYCVKEYAHPRSLQAMSFLLKRTRPMKEEEAELAIRSIRCGLILLADELSAKTRRTYQTFSISEVQRVLKQIFVGEKLDPALEIALIQANHSSPTEKYRETREQLFLALALERSLTTEAQMEAIPHFIEWGKSQKSTEILLSLAFFFEKGSFLGRDIQNFYPLLRQFESDPIAEALLMDHFIFGDLMGAFKADHDMDELLICGIRLRLQSRLPTALELYSHVSENAGSQPFFRGDGSVAPKMFALNRQGLIRNRENKLDEAIHLFDSAACTAEKAKNYYCTFVATNNAAAIHQQQSHLKGAIDLFSMVMNAGPNLKGKRSWENHAEGSLFYRRTFLAKQFSPDLTAANNLAVLKESISKPITTSVAEEIAGLYEKASVEGHPVAMYNYAIYLLDRPERNVGKATQLLKSVLALRYELMPMYDLIAHVLPFQSKELQDVEITSWKHGFEEIDGCLVSLKRAQTKLGPVMHVPTVLDDTFSDSFV